MTQYFYKVYLIGKIRPLRIWSKLDTKEFMELMGISGPGSLLHDRKYIIPVREIRYIKKVLK